MKYDLAEFEKRVDQGLIRRVEKEPLVLYNYTDKCTYEKAWDDYTRAARGIIFEKQTGKLVAKPFPKFFNLGEMPETQLLNLPNERYTITEKVDGSLGIIYSYADEWHVATRGSFDSEQAHKAKELLKKYDLSDLWPGLTYLVEIIYPENKIVVNYGKEEKLVWLGAWSVGMDFEIPNLAAFVEGMESAARYDYTIEEMIELQKTLPKDKEGFVVRFQGGLRVKIKGHEYLRIHKIISTLSPLSAWEAMELGKVRRDYLEQVPEEYLKDFQPIVDALEQQYTKICDHASKMYADLPVERTPREIGIFLKANPYYPHAGAMFSWHLGRHEAMDKYIMKAIRPDSNVLRNL